MSSELFRCKDRNKFPGLRGVFFDIVDQLPLGNAFCVYGGPSCSFEGMMAFVAKEQGHQFIVGGYMYAVPHRVTKRTRQTPPILNEKIIIVGRRDPKSSRKQAHTILLRPFQPLTWVMVVAVFFILLVFRIIIAGVSLEKRTFKNIVRHCVGEYDQVKLRRISDPESVRLLVKVAVYFWTFVVTSVFVVDFLFYEISVVNFLSRMPKHALQKGLANLSEEEMRKYIIPRGGAPEFIWRGYVDPGKKFENRTPPWHFCAGAKDW